MKNITCIIFDFDGARQCGCRFIGVANNWNKWGKSGVPFPLIRHINELMPLLG